MAFLIPSQQLMIAARDSNGHDGGTRRFVLSSRGWFDLQARLQSLRALPASHSEFERRYGGISPGLRMKQCHAAMTALRGVAIRYGDPGQVRATILRDPAAWVTGTRPRNNPFAAAIWTLEHARQDAVALAAAISSIPETTRGVPPRAAVGRIKALFLDSGQIGDRMQQSVIRLNLLINEFQTMVDDLENAQAIMRIYTDSSATTRRVLNQEIGGLQHEMDDLEKERDSAYARWLSLTVSTCLIPAMIGIVGIAIMVRLAVPIGESSFAVDRGAGGTGAGGTGAGGTGAGLAVAGLGTAAGLARSAYDDLIAQVSTTSDLMPRRAALRHDLGALDSAMRCSLPAAGEIVDQLSVIRDAWVDSVREIIYRLGELDDGKLISGPWLRDDQMAATAANWLTVDAGMRAFIGGTFVNSDLVGFGAALPKDDPNWQTTLQQKIAA